MVCFGVAARRVARILITHFHGDHCLGLPGVLQRLALDGAQHVVHVHFPASGQVFFDRLRQASLSRARVALEAHPIERAGVVARAGALRIEARPLQHTVETWGYRVDEEEGRTVVPERLAAAGIRGAEVGELVRRGELVREGRAIRLEDVSVPRPGQSLAFVMDTRPCRDAVELARGVDLLVCESTYLEAHADLARTYGHTTAAEAARLAVEAGAKRLVLTHFSSRYASAEEFLDEAGSIHPDVIAAQDGDRIALPRRSR
jgi:ribonuclease Z